MPKYPVEDFQAGYNELMASFAHQQQTISMLPTSENASVFAIYFLLIFAVMLPKSVPKLPRLKSQTGVPVRHDSS